MAPAPKTPSETIDGIVLCQCVASCGSGVERRARSRSPLAVDIVSPVDTGHVRLVAAAYQHQVPLGGEMVPQRPGRPGCRSRLG